VLKPFFSHGKPLTHTLPVQWLASDKGRSPLEENTSIWVRRSDTGSTQNRREQKMGYEADNLIDLNREQQFSETDTFTSERYAQFVKHFPPKTRDILDIGCNTGRGGQVMKSLIPTVQIVGLDCVVERLQSIDPIVYESTICGFASDIAVPSGSYDAIVAGEIIEHIPAISIFPTLCELFRVLRLKGRLLLTTPNPHYLRNRLQNTSVLSHPAHVSQHTMSSMRRKLEDAGFSRIRFYGSGRMTRYVGQYFPITSVYGSYLAVAEKW
jgi:2-polyprenyl-3-methyl-5-hydroxy-6-metoxy-1,4-benzoquinol methylase